MNPLKIYNSLEKRILMPSIFLFFIMYKIDTEEILWSVCIEKNNHCCTIHLFFLDTYPDVFNKFYELKT